MAKTIAYFDTKPIPASIDPEGGCSLQLKDRPIIEDDDVYEEVRKEFSLPINAKLIEFVSDCVLTGMAKKVAQDCNPRKIGNLLKFTPTLRGKVPSIYSAYDPLTCSSAIKVSSLSGLEKSIDETRVSFVNSRDPGNKVTISRVAYVGAQIDGIIRKNYQILAFGYNMQYLTGDTVIATYKNSAGTPVVVTMVPTESDVNHMLFNWPSGLDAAENGSEVVLTFSTRGGIEESEAQLNSKTVTVINGDTPTGPIQLLKVKEGTREDNIVFFTSSVVNVTTANLTGGFQDGDQLLFRGYENGQLWDEFYCTDCVSASSENHIEMNNGFTNLSQHQSTEWNGKAAKCVLIRDGVEYTCDCTFQQAS